MLAAAGLNSSLLIANAGMPALTPHPPGGGPGIIGNLAGFAGLTRSPRWRWGC